MQRQPVSRRAANAKAERNSTRQRQRTARATEVAKRRDVTPFPLSTPLQSYERIGAPRIPNYSDRNNLYAQLQLLGDISTELQLPVFERRVVGARQQALWTGRLEHLTPFASSQHWNYQSDVPISDDDTPDTDPSEPPPENARSNAMARNRGLLQRSERLEEINRDQALQAFEQSDVQRQLGSGNRHEVKQLQEGRGIVDYE